MPNPSLDILHVSAECYPVAKIGGLADVVGALPKYQQAMGHSATVIMPNYRNAFVQSAKLKEVFKGIAVVGNARPRFTVQELEEHDLGFRVLLVDIPRVEFSPAVYTTDDTERFAAFQVAVLNWLMRLKRRPDIIHCHDHHTGLMPFMLSHAKKYASLKKIPSVFTIHNAQYQGIFSHEKAALLPAFDPEHTGLLDWNNLINPFASAIKCAWRVTTVSPAYLEELKVRANTVETLIRSESAKCLGILNGIDTAVWNPETDPALVQQFSANDVASGKKAGKDWLCAQYGLDPALPLVVFIGRLVGEKGADLFADLFGQLAAAKQCSLLVLGSGNKTLEGQLTAMMDQHPGHFQGFMGYNEALAHKMYAGADFLLMPSRVEPCGLNQMYALRYGTVPIVSQVGGLRDTVEDLDSGGFGIRIGELTVPSIVHSVQRAVNFFKDQPAFEANRIRIMAIDHSWHASAQKYSELYHQIC